MPADASVRTQNPLTQPLPEYRERRNRRCAGAWQRCAQPTSSFSIRPTATHDQPEDLRRLGRRFAAHHLRPGSIVVFGTTPATPWNSPASTGTMNALMGNDARVFAIAE